MLEKMLIFSRATHAGFLQWQSPVRVKGQAHVLQVPGRGLPVVPRISDLWAENVQKSETKSRS